MKLFGTMEVKDNMLSIGGVSVEDLRKKYKTPLYVIDEEDFKNKAKCFVDNFKSEMFETRVIYASKAFTNLYMANLVNEVGLYMDVVSGGEIFTTLEGGVSSDKLYFHGNNKLYSEIEFAIEKNIGTFVIDNDYEYSLISDLAKEKNKLISVLLRVNPGIEATTHKYIQTAKDDSKFGMSIFNESTKDLIKTLVNDENIDFRGFHCHIGSQVFDENFFFASANAMIEFGKDMTEKHNFHLKEINLGGGFGVYYTNEDSPMDLEDFLKKYIYIIEEKLKELNLNIDIFSIEPGRSLINNSGSTIYSIGGIKETITGLKYIFIDGGMTDNPRHALYQAKYEASIGNKMDEENSTKYTIAGKCCETGDLLIEDIYLPEAKPGDILVISSTGAYNYSMSSNYNRIEKPAVVFVENGNVHLGVQRESYEDLIRNDQVRK